jgi:hypothetical protein
MCIQKGNMSSLRRLARQYKALLLKPSFSIMHTQCNMWWVMSQSLRRYIPLQFKCVDLRLQLREVSFDMRGLAAPDVPACVVAQHS